MTLILWLAAGTVFFILLYLLVAHKGKIIKDRLYEDDQIKTMSIEEDKKCSKNCKCNGNKSTKD
jgi:hypothetical protein